MLGRAPDFGSRRARMVERQLRMRGIRDERVLAAMGDVPREEFVGPSERRGAYDDSALPIGFGQTISQPWIVAAICQALHLEGTERVLEIGAGSGYSTAVLARLCAEVFAVERIHELAIAAAERLARDDVGSTRIIEADGSTGLPAEAPFEGIAVHAAAPAPPPSLLAQLAAGGRLVIPLASRGVDMLTVFIRAGAEGPDPETGAGLRREVLGPCRFVPLVGREGFPDQ